MNHIHCSTATLLAALTVLLATPNAKGQYGVVNPRTAQGHFSEYAVGVSYRGATSVMIRAPGVASGNPTPWTANDFGGAGADHPDYSIAALTQNWSTIPSGVSTPQFGDISSGSDLIPYVTGGNSCTGSVDSANCTGGTNCQGGGHLVMNYSTFSHWYTLTVAVEPAAQGTQGSMLQTYLTNSGRNPAGDIFSYCAAGSTLINSNLVDKVHLEASREQLHLPTEAVVPGLEIMNLDYHVGVNAASQGNLGVVTFPVHNKFFFTLTKAWATAAGNAGFNIAGDKPNASTVYLMTWSDPGTGWAWGEPVVAFGQDELFPDCEVEEIEIDGLAVDVGQVSGFVRVVVLSLTEESDAAAPDPATHFDQILVYQRDPLYGTAQFTPTQPLRTATAYGGHTFTNRLGLVVGGEPDDVVVLCGIDPPDMTNLERTIGRATDVTPVGESRLGLSAWRRCPPHTTSSPDDILSLQVTGLDYPGYPLGFIRLYLETEGEITESAPIWIDSTALALNAIDVSDAVRHYWQTPQTPTEWRLSAKIFGVDLTDATNPTEVPLRESWVISIEI